MACYWGHKKFQVQIKKTQEEGATLFCWHQLKLPIAFYLYLISESKPIKILCHLRDRDRQRSFMCVHRKGHLNKLFSLCSQLTSWLFTYLSWIDVICPHFFCVILPLNSHSGAWKFYFIALSIKTEGYVLRNFSLLLCRLKLNEPLFLWMK